MGSTNRKKFKHSGLNFFSHKRAFEIQFNWIFVLIAGTIILLVIVLFISSQRGISESAIKGETLNNLNFIISGLGASTVDTTKIIEDFPNLDVGISCDRISIGSVQKQFENLILFAPGMVKGDKKLAQSLNFNIPYRSINLIYLTSAKLKYILIGDTELAKLVNKTLPNEMNKDFYSSIPLIKNPNTYKVRFIVFGSMVAFPKSLEGMANSDVTALRVDGTDKSGTVVYYQKLGSSWDAKGSLGYLGRAGLIGAIYSDSKENYECNMANVFARMRLVTKVYLERTKEILSRSPFLAEDSKCSGFYASAAARLNKLFDAYSKYRAENIEIISDQSELLESDNKDAQLSSCNRIY